MFHDDADTEDAERGTHFNTIKPDRLTAESLKWRASGYSNGAGGMCVQVAQVHEGAGRGGFLVRDSRDPSGPVLAFSEAEWLAFLDDADAFRGVRV
ncbi:DUF397 domain-containing protein [Frankia sp. AgB1.9]|uniref:DUF397 domain-containing protein n=1 Tax=unclassified Frankia TaxID=2632575 RepID=UPI0019333886|nr:MULTISPECIES: DUF397 domain-containing protein [unclassified Frankia]MBL7486530.1 DUF397 domain-containing protein [Frankia sp. AgW1.1]MBL7554053.1 DUF397 domain-containing protein [Frankia sp. AgB1.9]MBL7618251.1 DUF397 domain-containing protein [Frankia sp. AgB1.8]